MRAFTVCGFLPGPIFPRVTGECVFAIGRKVFDQLAAHLVREARADADVLQRAGVVVKAQQKRSHSRTPAFFVPSKTSNDTIAIAFVLNLQHDPLIALVDARNALGYDAVETRALEASKPIGGDADLVACRSQMNRGHDG